jgi:1-acyl-sn-glycerol-3-phosphate acyltransferase
VEGFENIPGRGPCLITFNHYTSPRVKSWWMVLAVASVIPQEVHFIITAAWVQPGKWINRLSAPLTSWAFQRLADTCGFFTMPPMPPELSDATDRAQAVRRLLRFARNEYFAWIGLAPEGSDSPTGAIQMPPAGVGRLVRHLGQYGYVILPIGIFEAQEGDSTLPRLCLKFGPCYTLDLSTQVDRNDLDLSIRQLLMERIAPLLPPAFRGNFG